MRGSAHIGGSPTAEEPTTKENRVHPEENTPRPRWEEDAPRPRETWWDTWGKAATYLLLGIIAVVGAVLIALWLVGVLF